MPCPEDRTSNQCLGLSTPVAFIVFNRPHLAQQVFEVIAQAKPTKLLVVADGPRPHHPEEAERCDQTRAIIERVDWECEVLKNYSDVNLGCKRRVSTGLDWVFDQVEEAIVLEDDLLPHPSFFPFCAELLEKYRNNEGIMMVAGTNDLGEWKPERQSYHFTFSGGIWGWASWRRAWKHYDVDMRSWFEPATRRRIKEMLDDPDEWRWRKGHFNAVASGKIDTWDYQWYYARLLHSGLSIVPATNLIINIGFGNGATHTGDASDPRAGLPAGNLSFPLKHPDERVDDRQFARKRFLLMASRTSISKGLIRRCLGKFRRAVYSALSRLSRLREFR